MRNMIAFGMLLALLAACGPAVLPETSGETIETEVAAETLDLVPLNDPSMAGDLMQLKDDVQRRNTDDNLLLQKWHSEPILRWNEETRNWVIYYMLDPVVASRIYTLVSVAQQRALDELNSYYIDYEGRQPNELDKNIIPIDPGCQPFECAAILGATESVLVYLFPESFDAITITVTEARTSLYLSGTMLPSDLDAAEEIGRLAAGELIAERLDDGSADAKTVDILPKGWGIWKPDPFRVRPEMPGWGKVTPWLLTSADQFRAPPPPEFGSPEFEAALDEVRQTVVTNTSRELNLALIWADKRGSHTPPGHWNAIAADYIGQYRLSDRDASHVFAALNMAMMDAGIACWESKYHYMVVRPWQADPTISTLVGYPNHPSYPSGHSCFSAAAAEILSYFFPDDRDALWGMVEEASNSRLYGRIHYSFDIEAGKDLGRQVGLVARTFAVSQGWDVSR
ncbi:MAG: vanadium-dependent haloperoxidase [Anaerolineales bacterium]|nr:vanadium-dependent haloperoxidase [Anaerolineales bacterium]